MMEPLYKYIMALNNWEYCSDFDHQYLHYRLTKIQQSLNRSPSGVFIEIALCLCSNIQYSIGFKSIISFNSLSMCRGACDY